MAFRCFLPVSLSNAISATRARARVSAGAVLLDVSRNGDWRVAHALGATHIPLDQLADTMLSLSPRREIITICTSGVSAAAAARILSDAGFIAFSVRGGLAAWHAAGGAVHYERERDGEDDDAEDPRSYDDTEDPGSYEDAEHRDAYDDTKESAGPARARF